MLRAVAEQVWAIVDVYTRHFFQPTCAVHPPAPGLSQWFFVNVVFHHSELHLPLLRHPDEAPMAEHKKTSLLVNIPVLRVGYSWGGNGEALLGCDMRNVEAMSQAHSASGKQAGEKELLKPCSVKFNTFWNNPVDRELRTSTVTMSSTPIQLKVAFSQMPLLQDAASLFISKKQDDPHMVAETQDGLASSVPPSDATPSLGKTKSASPRQESRLRPAEASKKQSTSTRVSQDTAQTPQPSSLLKAVVTVCAWLSTPFPHLPPS